jgi:TRAP-type uncharacterized transport system fused permease subunit
VGSTGGQLMPPVMGASAFLMAEYLQISYGAVLVAATIPALLYYFALFMQVDTEAAKLGIAGAPLERLPALFEVLREGWHFLLPFAVIVAGLLAFRMEAETAALLATAVLVVACTVLRYRGRRSRPRGRPAPRCSTSCSSAPRRGSSSACSTSRGSPSA